MHKYTEKELAQLEGWLSLLINTYLQQPNKALAKIISYYIKKIMQYDEYHFLQHPRCEYVAMSKYWHWLSRN